MAPAPTPQGPSDSRLSPQVRRALAGLALVALLSSGLGLVYAGAVVVRDSTAGDVFAPIDDPEAPGFEAFLDTTPTMLVMHTVDGLIDSLTVLTLPSNDRGGGGVVFVPVRTVSDLGLLGVQAIEYAYDLGDARAQRQAVADLLGFALDEYIEIDAARWADLVRPVAPITIDNPDVLRAPSDDGEGPVLFAAGEIELDAEDVGRYLELVQPGESDLARLFRHEVFWRAWLEAVAAADRVDAVPGETGSGVARFVRLLSKGQTILETLPVSVTRRAIDDEGRGFLLDEDEAAELVARLVPYPQSPSPGARARVRVLNGTADTSQAVAVAGDLPPLGTEVELIGNATSFDIETTTISYFGTEFEPIAQAIRDELGVGEVLVESRPSDVVDITVTLGADYGG